MTPLTVNVSVPDAGMLSTVGHENGIDVGGGWCMERR
jgi:hypothetical protein